MPLPQNYQTRDLITVDTFETLSDYVSGGTGGGSTEENSDPAFIRNGSKSIKVTVPASGNRTIDKAINIDFSRAAMWGVWFYVADNNVASIQIYISSVSNFTSHLNVSQAISTGPGWKFVIFKRPNWTAAGGETWDTPKVIVRFRVNTNAGGVGVVYWDSAYANAYGRPKVIFTFDDASDDHYSEAYAYLETKGLKGVFFVPTDTIGAAQKLTWANLREMHQAGHDIANHTATHTDLTTYSTEAEIIADIRRAKDRLDSEGFRRSSRYLAYPNGGYNSAVVSAVKAAGMSMARSIVGGPEDHVLGLLDRWAMRCRSLTPAISQATAKGYIDDAIQNGRTIVLLNHGLVAAAPSGNQWLISDFRALVDYALSLQEQIDNPTWSEWEQGLVSGREVR